MDKIIYWLKKILKPSKVSINGVMLDLSDKHISWQMKKIFYKNKYEVEEVSILKNKLRSSDRIIEIGAGVGFLSAFCCKFSDIDPNNINVYEANPDLIKIIKSNYKLNKLNKTPIVHNCILSNKFGKVDFYCEENFWSSSTIKRNKLSKKISIESIDVNYEINRINPNFLIMDIEGGEKDLIEIIDLKPFNKIIIELHPHVIGMEKCTAVLQTIINSGFTLDIKESMKNVCYFYKSHQ
jgi:FkbM family methyltransferase